MMLKCMSRQTRAVVVLLPVLAWLPFHVGTTAAVAASAPPPGWSPVSSLSAARQNTTAASAPCQSNTAKTCIYAVGGYNGGDGYLSSVEMLDPGSNAWTAIAALPSQREDMAAASAPCQTNTANTCLYAVGGFSPSDTSTSTAPLLMFDPGNPANGWVAEAGLGTSLEDMGAASAPCTGATSKTCLYVVGGFDFNGGNLLPAVQMYDPSSNTWTSSAGSTASAPASLGSPLQDMGVATAGCTTNLSTSCLYAVGGWNGDQNNYTGAVEMYDPSNPLNGWVPVASLQTGRGGPTVSGPCPNTPTRSCLYAIGSYGGNWPGSILGSVEVYDPAFPGTGWVYALSLNEAREGLGAASAPCVGMLTQTCLYAVGGYGSDYLSSAEVYLPSAPVTLGTVYSTFYNNCCGSFNPSSVMFTQQLAAIDFDPPDGTVGSVPANAPDCNPPSGVNYGPAPFTDVVPNPDGTCTTMTALSNGQQNFSASFVSTLTVYQPGNQTFYTSSDDGFFIGFGSLGGAQPTYVSGARTNLPGQTYVDGFPVLVGDNSGHGANLYAYTINFPTPGTYPMELDYFNNSNGSESLTFDWLANHPLVSAPATPLSASLGPVSGTFYANPSNSGVFANPTSAPLFTQQFGAIDFNPPAGAVSGDVTDAPTCTPASGVDESTKPYTDVIPTFFGSAQTCVTQAAGGNGSAPFSNPAAFEDTYLSSLTVNAPGIQQFTVSSDDGFVFGIGAQGSHTPTYLAGPHTSLPTTTFEGGYPAMSGDNTAHSPTQVYSLAVYFPAAGTYPLEIDHAEDGTGTAALTFGIAVDSPLVTPPSSVPISQGWNLLDLPLQNSATGMASGLATTLGTALHKSTAIAAVATYAGGRFAFFIPGYSADQTLQPSQGIFVLSSVSGAWTPSGTAYSPPPTVPLLAGWNLVGAPAARAGYSGSSLDAQLGPGCGLQEAVVYRGTYATHIVNATAPFFVPYTAGMWVECAQAYAWTPG